jgi:hypothetical protein
MVKVMETKKSATKEPVEELRKRAEAEQELEKLLQLASKNQRLIEPRRSGPMTTVY